MEIMLCALECIRTKGETVEEPYLCVYVGDDLVREIGPFKMRRGYTEWLTAHRFEGEVIRVAVSDEDTFADEHYGSVSVVYSPDDPNATSRGMYVVNLPPSEARPRYKLYFIVRANNGHWPTEAYCLELVSIHCGDAQQYKDYVFIKVNGETVWGPTRMRTGDTEGLSSVESIPIHDFASIQLWEEDSSRNDYFGELSLEIGDDFDFDSIRPYTISADRYIIGDARYTLRYRVRERPWSSVTGWGDCRDIVDTSEEDAARPRNRIQLLLLKCDDAQGTHDTVRLYANENLLWGSTDMRTGEEVDLGEVSIDFRSSVTVRLEETHRQDWSQEFTIYYGETGYVINRRRTHRFHVDRSITGDATYTLTYRLRRLPAR